ncbi:hypothetical protein BD769DRAFT_1390802 [Suillus cothurnatus]|nr:hypothetical protein BD769DRAFT_1390802 [Suillus cothurnatus]
MSVTPLDAFSERPLVMLGWRISLWDFHWLCWSRISLKADVDSMNCSILTLSTWNGTVTAMTASGATNQTVFAWWNFQPSGNNWTITNTSYTLTTYAYSAGQSSSMVSGNALSTEWNIIPNSSNYSFQLGSNNSFAWSVSTNDQVTLAGTQLQNNVQQLSVE